MNFFCTKKHLEEYAKAKDLKHEEFYSLSLPLAVEAARYLFTN
jgi:hypothetical protein